MRYLQHFRPEFFGHVLPTGGRTVAIEVTPTEVKFGIARCHHPDVFSRKIGNTLATQKLNEAPRTLSIEKFRTYLTKTSKSSVFKAEAMDEIIATITFDKINASVLLMYVNKTFKS